MKLRALDLFCGAGGVSVGLARAGFDVVGVDRNPEKGETHWRAVERCWRRGMEPYGGQFVCGDALEFPLEGFDLICASPPCQAHTSLRHLHRHLVYPDLIAATRERLQAAGIPWVIENVPDAPLGGANLVLLCGSMFGLQTPDGRAELRRHRLFETSFSIALRLACQHGDRPALSVVGHTAEAKLDGYAGRPRPVVTVSGDKPNRPRVKTISVTGATPQRQKVHNKELETFSVDDARAAMGIPWMPMRFLSQAIPPAYSEWIGRQALTYLESQRTSEVEYRAQFQQEPLQEEPPPPRVDRPRVSESRKWSAW